MSTSNLVYREVATQLAAARARATPLVDLRAFKGCTLEDGYAVQKAWIDLAKKKGDRVSGWKVAMANQPALDRFKLSEPVYGVLFSDMVLEKNTLDVNNFIEPKIEAELAFILMKNLEGVNISDDEIINAIGFLAPALEIADTRMANWTFSIAEFLADNAVAAAYKIGTRIPFDRASYIDDIECSLSFSGEHVLGGSASVLGGPLNSFVKMVRHIIDIHGRAECGQHFLTGSLIKPVTMVPGTTYKLDMMESQMSLTYQKDNHE